MDLFEFTAPCHFGLEAVLKREITNLGFKIMETTDGRVTFSGGIESMCEANIRLRSAERVLLKVGEFKAESFEELFQGTLACPWEKFIPEDGKFWVTKAASVKSALFSPSDIQSVMKKAMVDRLHKIYNKNIFPESGAHYPVRVFIKNDIVTVCLDTTGTSLHKRGYREMAGKAPISETLAAALIMLTPWNKDRILVDPFCGSGTFLIEAAMMAANIAPGLKRSFLSESWTNLIKEDSWAAVREKCESRISIPEKTDLQGYDADKDVIAVARENAAKAGVAQLIHFQVRDVSALSHPKKYGFIITNPPYGERLEELEALPALYKELGERFKALDSWSAYIISSYEQTEKYMGQKANKNRKLYNGMIKTYFYQFEGPKPPKKHDIKA
ncbi:MAG: class I SAM-dependent RNA methyltransferase [Lachnospiraceae bacterium]|jgi:putative N6-adenine-specific DNA methylase|nr:class I SAM-dependent RNA methyltransferase [Lachnospiraceae bacterium]